MHDDGLERLIKDVQSRQKNTVFPDTLPNSRTIDAFFWKGDPKASLIPRIGLVLFGLFFLLAAIAIISIAFQKRDGWFWDFFMAMLGILIAARLLRNAFLRSPKRNGDSPRQRF